MSGIIRSQGGHSYLDTWHLGEPLKGSAIQESPLLPRGQDGKLNKGCTVHKGFNSNCMESRRKENFSEAVKCTKVNSGISSTLVLQRSTLLSSRQLSHACAPMVVKFFVSKSGDSRGAETAWRQLTELQQLDLSRNLRITE